MYLSIYTHDLPRFDRHIPQRLGWSTITKQEQRAMFCCKCVGKKTHLDGMLKEDVIQDHHEQQEWNDSYHDYQQYRFYFGIISKTNLQCSSLSAATSC